MEYAEPEYITYLYTGSEADTAIDEEAREIFLNNADLFYTDASLSDDAYLAKIFRDLADSIMKSRAGSGSCFWDKLLLLFSGRLYNMDV